MHYTYTREQTTHWLSWLARQMKQHNQTVFYIEHLQPDWLSGERARQAYDRWALRFPAVLMGILVSITINSLFTPAPLSLPSLALNMVLGGFIGWLLSAESSIQQPHESSKRVKRGTGSRLVRQLKAGAFIGLGAGLITGLIAGLFGWLSFGVFGGLITGLSNGLSFGLGFGLSAGLLSGLLTREPVGIFLTDELNWSWRSLGRSLFAKRHIYTALCVMALIVLITGLNEVLRNKLIIGLSNGLIIGLSNGLIDGLIIGLSSGLVVGLSLWLLLGFFQGVSSETIEDQRRVVPNQGIRRSARNSLVFGLISTGIVLLSFVLSSGLVVALGVALFSGGFDRFSMSGGSVAELSFVERGGVFGELSTGLNPTLGFVLSFGLSAGLLAGLLYGGLACLRHIVIRHLLLRAGSIPRNYQCFLDDAAERILLRKVGGGYSFVDRSLLEDFASLDSTPTRDEART